MDDAQTDGVPAWWRTSRHSAAGPRACVQVGKATRRPDRTITLGWPGSSPGASGRPEILWSASSLEDTPPVTGERARPVAPRRMDHIPETLERRLTELGIDQRVHALSENNLIRVVQTPAMWGTPMTRENTSAFADRAVGELADTVRRIIGRGTRLVDVVTLSPPTGRLLDAVKSGLREIAERTGPTPTLARFMFGYLPLEDTVADFVRDLRTFLKAERVPMDRVTVLVGQVSSAVSGFWNHAKIVATDGGAALVGGHNLWTDTYGSYPPVHDISIEMVGDGARHAHGFADYLWTKGGKNLQVWRITADYRAKSIAAGSKRDRIASIRLDDDLPRVEPADPPQDGPTRWHRGKALSLGRAGFLGDDASDVAKEMVIKGARQSLKISQMDLAFTGFTAEKDHKAARWIAEALVGNPALTVDIVVSPVNASATGGANSWGFGAAGTYAMIKRFVQKATAVYNLDNNELADSALRRLRVAPLVFTDLDSVVEGEYAWPDPPKEAVAPRYEPGSWTTTMKKYAPAPSNHAKVYIADDTVYYVGSDNLYPHKLAEFGYLVEGDAVQDMVRTYWDQLWRYSGPHAVDVHRDVIADWEAESRLGVTSPRSLALRDIDTALDRWRQEGRRNPQSLGQNKRQLQAVLDAIAQWRAGREGRSSQRSRPVALLEESIQRERDAVARREAAANAAAAASTIVDGWLGESAVEGISRSSALRDLDTAVQVVRDGRDDAASLRAVLHAIDEWRTTKAGPSARDQAVGRLQAAIEARLAHHQNAAGPGGPPRSRATMTGGGGPARPGASGTARAALAGLEEKYFPPHLSLGTRNQANTVVTTHVDGDAYFGAIAEVLDTLHGPGDRLYISSWWLHLATRLRTGVGEPNLGDRLVSLAAAGVDVRLVVSVPRHSISPFEKPLAQQDFWRWPYAKVLGVFPMTNLTSVRTLRAAEVEGRPVLAGRVLIDWGGDLDSRHEKSTIAYSGTTGELHAFVGGLDYVPNRSTTEGHAGTPRYNAWHDVGVQLRGGAAEEVLSNFWTRWEETVTLPERSYYLDGTGEPFNPAAEPKPERPVPPRSPRPIETPAGSHGDIAVRVWRSYGPNRVDPLAGDSLRLTWRTLPPEGVAEISTGLIAAIDAAQRYIYVEDQTLNPSLMGQLHVRHNVLFPAITRALSRGVKVLFVTQGFAGRGVPSKVADPGVSSEIASLILDRLTPEQQRNFALFSLKDVKVHSKVVLIDDEFATIGSANFWDRSMVGAETEVTAAIVHPGGPDSLVADLRVQLWREHLRLPETAAADAGLRDLDVGFGYFRSDWGTADPSDVPGSALQEARQGAVTSRLRGLAAVVAGQPLSPKAPAATTTRAQAAPPDVPAVSDVPDDHGAGADADMATVPRVLSKLPARRFEELVEQTREDMAHPPVTFPGGVVGERVQLADLPAGVHDDVLRAVQRKLLASRAPSEQAGAEQTSSPGRDGDTAGGAGTETAGPDQAGEAGADGATRARERWQRLTAEHGATSYANHPERASAAAERVAERLRRGEPPLPFSPDSSPGAHVGREFGMEVEVDFQQAQDWEDTIARFGEDLSTAGLVRDARIGLHKNAQVTGYTRDHGDWRLEREQDAGQAELVSPISRDEPATWAGLTKLLDIARRHNGRDHPASHELESVGGHVHVSTGDYRTAATYQTLLHLFRAFEDVLFRLATNPRTGRHRGIAHSYPAQAFQIGPDDAIEDMLGTSRFPHALSFKGVHGDTSDHVEWRLWDGSVDEAEWQTRVRLSVAIVEAALRLTGDPDLAGRLGTEPLGTHAGTGRQVLYTGAHRGEPVTVYRDSPEDVRSLLRLLDLVFTRDEDKDRVLELFALTTWAEHDAAWPIPQDDPELTWTRPAKALVMQRTAAGITLNERPQKLFALARSALAGKPVFMLATDDSDGRPEVYSPDYEHFFWPGPRQLAALLPHGGWRPGQALVLGLYNVAPVTDELLQRATHLGDFVGTPVYIPIIPQRLNARHAQLLSRYQVFANPATPPWVDSDGVSLPEALLRYTPPALTPEPGPLGDLHEVPLDMSRMIDPDTVVGRYGDATAKLARTAPQEPGRSYKEEGEAVADFDTEVWHSGRLHELTRPTAATARVPMPPRYLRDLTGHVTRVLRRQGWIPIDRSSDRPGAWLDTVRDHYALLNDVQQRNPIVQIAEYVARSIAKSGRVTARTPLARVRQLAVQAEQFGQDVAADETQVCLIIAAALIRRLAPDGIAPVRATDDLVIGSAAAERYMRLPPDQWAAVDSWRKLVATVPVDGAAVLVYGRPNDDGHAVALVDTIEGVQVIDPRSRQDVRVYPAPRNDLPAPPGQEARPVLVGARALIFDSAGRRIPPSRAPAPATRTAEALTDPGSRRVGAPGSARTPDDRARRVASAFFDEPRGTTPAPSPETTRPISAGSPHVEVGSEGFSWVSASISAEAPAGQRACVEVAVISGSPRRGRGPTGRRRLRSRG